MNGQDTVPITLFQKQTFLRTVAKIFLIKTIALLWLNGNLTFVRAITACDWNTHELVTQSAQKVKGSKYFPKPV